MLKNLRLLLFSECNRSCEGCCNNDWDLTSIDICKSFQGYDKIILTGGEPMLNPALVIDTAARIRKETNSEIIMYTAKSKRALDLVAVLHILDGITLTLHEPYDVKPFIELNNILLKMGLEKSLRLNVFAGIDISGIDLSLWKVKEGIEWIKDCPLPETEVFMRLT